MLIIGLESKNIRLVFYERLGCESLWDIFFESPIKVFTLVLCKFFAINGSRRLEVNFFDMPTISKHFLAGAVKIKYYSREKIEIFSKKFSNFLIILSSSEDLQLAMSKQRSKWLDDHFDGLFWDLKLTFSCCYLSSVLRVQRNNLI